MKNKVYVLFQTDIWKTKSSRVCFGVFLYENAAIDAAWKSHSTLTLLATQNYPFLLKYDCPLWLK